ncbi:MAG: RluA family pseudouridine synthase [Bacteroidaceae bacterium]|nr:RluA family pseudouridine synthase [Bacteroidaceae bacterium]
MRQPGHKSYRINSDNVRSFKVPQENTLLPFLLQVLKDKNRTEVKNLLKYRHVAVKGKVVSQYDTPLQPGDSVDVNLGRSFIRFNNPQIRIIYEDEWLIVTEKSSGLLSVANEKHRDNNAFNIILDYLRCDNPEAELYVCHRLDQYTSGILMFVKNRELQQELRENWDFYVKERRYVCVTERVPEKPEDEIRSLLTENDRLQVHSTNDKDEGHLAITRYKLLQSNGRFALIDVEIFTGKKNQIRVHMTEMGCPIAGDLKYGAETNPAHRLMLHNYRFCFIHPISGELMEFQLGIPQAFRRLTQSRTVK